MPTSQPVHDNAAGVSSLSTQLPTRPAPSIPVAAAAAPYTPFVAASYDATFAAQKPAPAEPAPVNLLEDFDMHMQLQRGGFSGQQEVPIDYHSPEDTVHSLGSAVHQRHNSDLPSYDNIDDVQASVTDSLLPSPSPPKGMGHYGNHRPLLNLGNDEPDEVCVCVCALLETCAHTRMHMLVRLGEPFSHVAAEAV